MGSYHPFRVVSDFEHAVAEYTGAPYVVAVNSCTNALFLALMCYRRMIHDIHEPVENTIFIPKRTYVGVAMSIINAGFNIGFEDLNWSGMYKLKPYPIWDAARRFTSSMYIQGHMMCTSHHWSKILGIQQGGCILLDNYEVLDWFRRARFDGRTAHVPASKDRPTHRGWHMYMSPEIAAEGLVRLAHLPQHNEDLPNDDYPDLSQIELFR